MAAERQQLDANTLISTAPVSTTIPAASPDPALLDHPTTTNPPKRQRRPSVRLGEIGGDPPYDSHIRRPNKTWRFHKDPSFAAQNSKTRPLTNLVNDGCDVEDESNYLDTVEPTENYADFSHRKPKTRRPTKRARTNWNNKFESTIVDNGGSGVGGGGVIESTNIFQEDNQNNNEEFREFEPEGSESPLLKKQQSPVNSMENMGLQFWDRKRRGNRVGSNGMLHNEVNSPEEMNEGSLGVRQWLIGLGLRRYAPVFEIHEVDDEVLPMLTLEDLKDMGINAVGSRRKMYSAILKLRKGFS